MEKERVIAKKGMIQLYKDYNILSPSDQALGRFAKSLGYERKRVMKKGKTEVWYVLKETL